MAQERVEQTTTERTTTETVEKPADKPDGGDVNVNIEKPEKD